MAAPEDGGRISVSRDALRAELVGLELRLVEKLATKTEHDGLASRVDKLERWRAYSMGITAALTFGLTLVATVSWHIWG